MRETSYQLFTHDSQQPKAYRGGERKVMKKSLSLLLAIALVFSAFTSLASAAVSPSQAANKLVNAGVIKGTIGGDLQEGQEWKRQDVSVLLSRLLGVEDEAKATAKGHTFADVTDPYYDGYVTWAKDEGLMEGHSAVRFGYNENITAQQFAMVLLRALGIDAEYDAALEVAIENGLIAEGTDNSKPFTRGTSYVAIVNTLDSEVEEGVTLGAKLGLKGWVPEKGAVASDIASFRAVGAKKLEVAFNGKVSDASKVEFGLRKGSINTNVAKVEFSEDQTKATIETSAKLTKGEYTVTVKNVAKEDLTRTVSVEDEVVAKIEFTSDKAPLVKEANGTIGYKKVYTWVKVTNQYGEDITSTTSGLTFTAGKGTVSPKLNDGIIEITSTQDYLLNEKFSVSVVHTGSQKFASAILTVSPPAQVASIKIKELVKDGDATLNVTADPDKFWLLVEAEDQYGNKVPANQVGQDIIVSVANTNVVNVKQNANKDPQFESKDNETILKLAKASNVEAGNNFGRGKTTVHMFSRTTPSQASIEIEVVDTAKVDKLTLSSPDIAVIGEKVEIPFTAINQFGEEMNNADDIRGGLQSKISVSGLADATIDFEQDYVNNKAKLILNLENVANKNNITNSVPLFITAYTSTFEIAQLNVTAQPVKKPEVIHDSEGTTKAIALGGKTTFDMGKIKVIDQYGRTFNAKDYAGYVVQIESSDAAKVSFDQDSAVKTAVLSNDAKKDVFARDAGSSTFTLKLYKGSVSSDNEVSGSDLTLTIRAVKVDDIASYEVGELPVLYAGGSKYQKELKVNGVLSDGTKVSIPVNDSRYYSVTNVVYGDLVYTGDGKVYATSNAVEKDKEKTFALVVRTETKDTVQTHTVEVKVSGVEPEVKTWEVRDGDTVKVKKVADGVVKVDRATARALNNQANLNKLAVEAIKLVDQYGVEIDTNKFVSVELSNVPDKDVTKIDYSKTFNIVAVTQNATAVVVKVHVDNF